MNIESTNTATIAKQGDVSTSASTTAVQSKDDTRSFKDQLEAVKGHDSKTEQTKTSVDTKNQEAVQSAKTKEATKTNQQAGQNAETEETIKAAPQEEADKKANSQQLTSAQAITGNVSQNSSKDKQTDVKNKMSGVIKNADVESSLDELNSRIATLTELKQNSGSKIQNCATKTKETEDYCKTIKMDNNDTKFFINLVNNQQMSAQGSQINTQINNPGVVNNNFTEIKSEATGQTVQISNALLDAVNESFKTNKPLRIDFGNDVAVIMKVDKEGVLSANFIPGSAAVEAYLQNNIGSLRQNFDNQNLPYNELSYNRQQRQQQNQNKNKENENE